jgi:hypothetical protein
MNGLGLFLQSLIGGLLLALLGLLAWRLAQRIGLLLPRQKAARRKLKCVRPLDFDA